MARDPESNPWTTLSSRQVYDNPWIRVEEHRVLNPAGGPGIYGVVHYKNVAIGVLPLFADGTTVAVGQFRYPHGSYSWEIPEGGGPPDQTPLQSAQRELREETGLVAASWQEVLRMDLSNSVSDEGAVCFIAWDLTQRDASPEETEALRLRRLPFDALLAEVLDGRIRDSMTVATVLKVAVLRAGAALPAPVLAALGA